jgi:LPXTG-motif cell wall-anchored protein
MNNRRSLKENLTISNKQRFGIRKFSIGVASVMLGTTLYFMGGVGPSIVHADSVQEQSVQTPKLDTNSAQASSDTSSAEQTSSQNQTSSAQNSQKAVSNASANTKSTDSKTQTSDQVANATTDKKSASQADNASATNSKTQDNKKVVSDANRAKSTANDAQTKSAQQTAKSDAANSNTLVVQQTKKLTGNAKLNKLVDSKAQTDTKTDSNYSVTDNYPEGLMNYLPSDFNNKQEYAFEWLRNENNNNIILTTNRTGDGEVYVYQDRKQVGTLATKSSQPLYVTNIGTVYNDDFAGIVQSNGYLLNIIYSSHAKDVDNAGSSYSTVSFFVPHKITQTVTYKDSKGNVIDSLTHTQDGLTGQSYTTGLPSGSDYVRYGEYLDNITNNGSGLISEFYDGYKCTKNYHDGVSVTFTENDSEGIGAMDYVVKDHGIEVKSGTLTYGNSAEYDKYAWNGLYWYKSHSYTIVNPYVPQTTNIVYQYKKLGQVITTYPSGTDPSGNEPEVYYTNDRYDPTKIEPVNAKPITGYSAIVKYENKIVSGKNFMPTNLGENTYITYVANAQKAGIKYIDDVTKETLSTDTDNGKGKFGQPITFRTDPANTIKDYEDQGYKLVSNNFKTTDTYQADNNKNQFEVHFIHGTTDVTPDKPKTPSDIIPGTTKHYPSGVDKDDLNKTVTRTINVISPDGKTTTIKQPVTLQRSATVDDVTGQITYKDWNTGNWEEYDTPQISGYTPSQAKVSATTVDGNTQDQTVTITYVANAQKAGIKYIDDVTKETLSTDTDNGKGKFGQPITFRTDPANTIKDYEDQGYKLVSNNFKTTDTYQADNNKNQFEVHFIHGTTDVTPDKPKTPSDIIPGTTKHYPSGVDKDDLNKTVTRTINVISPDGKTTTIKQPVTLQRSATVDDVTGQITYKDWNTGNWEEYDTPQISGYTPSQAKVSATTVDGNTQDQTVTITYVANAQKASVTYVDDKTGKTLKVDNLNGATNAKSGYTTKAAIDTYTGLGYTLVSDDTNGKEVVFDNDDAVDQAFTVHLSHGTITVTPENPGKPGEPVDPDNPDGPKYPDGTDEYQVKRTGTQTIHYVGAGDKTPADNKQTFVFTREITFDDVTGKIISVTPWNVQGHTFGKVDTPVIPGYHADKAVAGGATVTPDDLNKVIIVTYAPDGGSGDNPGSSGGGDQGTTPTPEPVPEPTPSPDDQPDTTLPSDNNTDKDVEKDKQDKPEKVKKARKIIKTRITKQEHIGNAEKAEPLAEQEHNDQTVASPVKNEANEPRLPQTGEANTSVIGLLGMLVAGFAAILGFESSRSRSRKHKN